MSVSSISIGKVIRGILASNGDLKKKTTKIFPVVTSTANLPYISYRLTGLQGIPTKTYSNADVVTVEVLCFADTYEHSVELAELVRNALDGAQGEYSGVRMRSCMLSGAEDAWENDAYIERLVFTIRASGIV